MNLCAYAPDEPLDKPREERLDKTFSERDVTLYVTSVARYAN